MAAAGMIPRFTAAAAIFAVIVAVIEGGIVAEGTGRLLLALYFIPASFFMLAGIRTILISTGLSAIVTLFFAIASAQSLGVLGDAPGIILLILGNLAAFLFLQAAIFRREKNKGKAALYGSYLLIDSVQVFVIMVSLSLFFVSSNAKNPEAAAGASAAAVILFTLSTALLGYMTVRSFSSREFSKDFSMALTPIKDEAGEMEDEALRDFKKVRLFTYLLFVCSLAVMYLTAVSGSVEKHLEAASANKGFAGAVFSLINNFRLPGPVLDILKILFFVFDAYILKEFVEIVTKRRFRDVLVAVFSPKEKVNKKAIELNGGVNEEIELIMNILLVKCRLDGKGNGREMCDECRETYVYMVSGIKRCRYGTAKPSCPDCPQRCFGPEMKERVEQVLRCYR